LSSTRAPIDKKLELVTALVLAVAVVGIAWCAYQSHVWHTVETFKIRDMNYDIVNYAMKNLQQGQTIVYDTVRFTAYSDALVLKEQNLSNFYYERFRPEMKTAVDAWLKMDPFNNKTAPPTPFYLAEYNKTFALEAQQFASDSESKLEEAHDAAKHSEEYLMLTVVYSSALFIGAILDKLFHRQARLVLFILATSITSIATILLAFMPVGANSF